MRKNPASQSGIFNPRVFAAFSLCSIGALLAMLSFASDPPTNSITVPSTTGQTVTVIWTGEIPPLVNGASDCTNLADTPVVDQHLPTVTVPAGIYNTLNAKFTFNITWDGAAGNDEILTVLKPDGTTLDSSDGGDPSETVTGYNLDPGTYKVIACGFLSGPSPQSYTGKLTIDTSSGAPPPPPLPTPPPAVPGVPRYYNYFPPAGIGEAAGEPTMGFNLATKKAMYIAGLQTLRVTFPDTGACQALWEDVSFVYTATKSLDPILFTDQYTNRTFVSQLDSVVPPAAPVLIGLDSFMAYTDDDGANWTPAQIDPPDGSYDHQAVGAGPYPALLPLGNPVNKGSAVYYCSQAGVTAFCSRSDDGGLNFGPARTVHTSVSSPAGPGCSAIHGHPEVAPDGTVYLPVRSCDGVQSVIVSEDAGVTWEARLVQGTNAQGQPFAAAPPPGILDPDVGIATDGTLYFTYIANEGGDGHAHVAVSHDKGLTWINDTDLGTSYQLKNMVFANAHAGDPDRAAVGFLGTTQTGDHQAADFNGIWYVFFAHTYDGGQNWVTVNATPDDPVQREACIWNGGGANQCRNLLDFNGITMDDKGRVLYSYADGCIDGCVNGPPNSYSSRATIARQSGGKGLLAVHDITEPLLPQAACLSGRRDDLGSYLSWVAPDNGGSDIIQYKIFRGTTPNNMVQIGQQLLNKTTYTDRSVVTTVPIYTYKIIAVNSQGDGPVSNIISLPLGPRPPTTGACTAPGIQLLVDPQGDPTDTNAQHDITSISMAEPLDDPVTGAASKIYFTIKVADLTAPIAPGWRWSIRFVVPGFSPPAHPVLGAQEDWHVSMVSSDGAAPTFTYGTTGVFQGASRFFVTLGNLDASSTVQPDGTITLVLPKSVFPGIDPGDAININLGSVRATVPSAIPGTGGTNETIPDTTGAASYTLRAANLCLPNTEPLAVLASNINTGVQPLTVNFDGSGSSDSDPIDTIATYAFNFGEGDDDVVQSTPTISHTFNNAGLYDVKLVVTDSRGKLSSNTAHQLIEVLQPLGLATVVSRKAHGTAGNFDIDLPLTGAAGVECRGTGSTGNAYQIVYTFNRDVTVAGNAIKTQGTATLGTPTLGPNSNQVTVPLTNVSNLQHVIVKLNGVHDAVGSINNSTARLDVLIGDVNGTRVVTSGDTNLCKAQALQQVTSVNFRNDINASGAITTGDVNIIKQNALSQLPAEPAN